MEQEQAQKQSSKIEKSETEWKTQLSPERYRVLREKGTEPAFSGALYRNREDGTYRCAACGAELFSSETKFESGTGWPGFWVPTDPKAIEMYEDTSYGMRRVEVTCARCGSHLGHVFPDGPQPTGLRYCINSLALDFVPGSEEREVRRG